MRVDAEAVRREFDAGFAAAPAPARDLVSIALLVRAGGGVHAVLRRELTAIHAGLRIVPMPSPAPELLGIAQVRNELIPVYDLALLLGLAPSPSPRWLALAGTPPIALAFEDFAGQAEVERAERLHLWIGERAYPRIDAAALAASLLERWKER